MNNKQKKIIYILVISLCIISFISSATYLAYNTYTVFKEEQLIREIQSKKKTETEIEKDTGVEIEPIQILAEYRDLYKENNDLYGWIKIEGTDINYPVMFTPDEPNFYLNRNWNKEYSSLGSIFVSCETKEDSENIIIYGHDMRNHIMFGTLKLYKDKNYYEEHKYIQFDTLYEKQTYEIISVLKTKIYYDEKQMPNDVYLYYDHIELDTKEEFDDYINFIKKNAWYDIDITATFKDQLITLSTCDYWTKDGRLLIVAKKI